MMKFLLVSVLISFSLDERALEDHQFMQPYWRSSLWIDLDGHVKTRSTHELRLIFVPEQDVLFSHEIQQELELVEGQSTPLRQIRKTLELTKKRYLAEVVNKPTKTQISYYMKFRKETTNKINSILLPHQRVRLAEVALFLDLRSKGIYKFLRQFAEKNDLPINDRAIREKIKSERKRVMDIGGEHAEKLLEECLSVLSKKQRSKLQQITGDLTLEKSNLEWFYLDVADAGQKKRQGSRESSLFDLMRGVNSFVSKLDGGWERRSKSWYTDEQLLTGLMKSINAKPSCFPELELTQIQVDNIATLIAEISDSRRENNRRFGEAIDASSSVESKTKTMSLFREEKLSLLDRQTSKFMEIVPENQLQKLKPRFLMINILSNGVVSELTKSEWLRKELSLSESQTKHLEARAKSAFEKAKKIMDKLESEIIKEVLSSQNQKTNSLVLKSLGERPSHIPPSIGAILK